MTKLLLVNPRGFDLSNFTGGRWGMLPVTLPTVTALTPQDWEVRVLDEYLEEKIDFDEPVDVVGITILPPQYQRARRIAEEFRRRGVLVVVGGPFPSLSPDRCRDFADVLFIGRAERTWPQFCKDYLANDYEREYVDNNPVDFSLVPNADYRGFSPQALASYTSAVIHIESGCPHRCDFCDAVIYSGNVLKIRPADKIIEEIEKLHGLGIRAAFLATDDLLVNRAETKKIMRRLVEWQQAQKEPMTFFTNIDIAVCRDDEFLELSAQAGLLTYLVGFESPNKESLFSVGKKVNLKHDSHAAVRKIFEHGIQVYGYLMVGFDEDDLTIFQKQVDFFQGLGLAWSNINVVDARDGTALKDRMVKEGRYVDFMVGGYGRPWGEIKPNNINLTSIIPKNMTVQQLRQGTYWTLKQLCDWDNFKQRVKVFFETYEASPKKGTLTIPRQLPPKELPMPIRNFLATASPDEKEAWEFTFGCGMRSSHPQGIGIAVRAFMPNLGLRRMLAQQIPNMDEITYPQ